MFRLVFLIYAIFFSHTTLLSADSVCNILKNPDFEESFDNWSTYSTATKLVADGYASNKAVQIKDGGMDQVSGHLNGTVDTYQFEGYYKNYDEPKGIWVGINFYDKDYNLLFSKSITLKVADEYHKFSVSGTSNDKTAFVQAWVWSDSNEGEGEVVLDGLKISTSGCYDQVLPSSLPPHGMAVDKSPQFVVIGFDDNTKSEGIEWALNLFADKKNADGSDARVSFYMNTIGLDDFMEDEPTKLLEAMKTLKNSSHEIGNHTYGHLSDIGFDNWDLFEQTVRTFDDATWGERVKNGLEPLVGQVGISKENIVGFRAPFLLYNQSLLNQLAAQNFLYDCSIEEGYASEFDGTNFRWPYQLDSGSPGHNESWYGNPKNPNHIEIKAVPKLWELPNHVLMIPKDNECAKYGIQIGLWDRILKELPFLNDFKITGFDYNLWNIVKLNKAEVLGILKYNLDLRLKGNRAPFMFGAHTQYYTDEWAATHAPNATASQMREAISEFINYALSKPEVRIRPAIDIINWCSNPTPIN